MGSAIVYSKKLKGEVLTKPNFFTGNIAVFAGMLSKKPCKIEKISFNEETELLLLAADVAGILESRDACSVSFKGNPEPVAMYTEVTKGMFDDYTDIPYQPTGKEYFLRSDIREDVIIALFMGAVLAEEDSHIVFTGFPDAHGAIELCLSVLGRFGVFAEVSND